MLAAIVRFALSQRVLVLALAALMLVLGLRAGSNVPVDVFPEFAPPMVEIQTEAPGLSTEEVESLITVPLETAVNGVPDLATLRSKSVLGLSSVQILFERGTDLMRARQMVGERVAQVQPRLPLAARQPVVMPPLSSTSRAMKIGLSSPTLDAMQLSELVRWTIRPRLMAVPGVANVAVWGQRDRQLQVLVDPERLRAAGVTLAEVRAAAGNAVLVGGGGFIDTPNQRLSVQQAGVVGSAADLARAVIRHSGDAAIRLGDVADVTEGYAPPIGNAIIDDGPGIMLIVEKQPTANTLALTHAVEAAVAQLRPGLGDVKVDTTIFRPATFIERSIDNLTRALLVGCLLVAIVLFVFTRNVRQAAISLIAIPLSLLGAGLVLLWSGATINVMVIAGLVIALGEIVDDAIIDVENIARRLRLNGESGDPKPPLKVVLAASLEVRSAVVLASLIVMLVFLPIFFLGGLAGTFFRPLALAYVLAIGTSLLIALSVTPALCLVLLPASALKEEQRETRLVAWLKARYIKVLPRFIERPRLAMGIVAGGLLLAGIGYASFKDQFLPDFRETDFLMHFVEKPGTSIEAMDRITIRASQELRSIPGVRNFGAHIGRAEAADEVVGPNFTELWISLDEKADYDASLARIKQVIAGYPGLFRDVLTYLRERIKEVLTGAGATVVVRIFGPEQNELRAAGQRVREAVSAIPGVADLKVESQVLVPQIRIRPRPAELERLGLSAGELRAQAQMLVAQQKVGEIYRDQKSFEVAVWGVPEVRNNLHALQDLLIDTAHGAPVRLRDVAEVEVVPAPNEIKRENSQRRLDVTLNVSGADLGSVARQVEAAVGKVPFAAGYHPEVLGEYAALKESRNRLWTVGALCLVGVLLLVWMEFQSATITTLVGASLPFVLVGGVVAVLLSGGVLSLGSLVGFVTVIGIAARNGIMLLSHYQHLEHQEGVPFGPGLILRGAAERLVPITMTATCAGLALVPLIVAGNAPGHEIEHPMALVILGGLVSSTLLNLFLMPALYAHFGDRRSAASHQAVTP
ncbi:MAG: efflux RND transporter permease subunit [Steroidobacteraceae bacterium]